MRIVTFRIIGGNPAIYKAAPICPDGHRLSTEPNTLPFVY